MWVVKLGGSLTRDSSLLDWLRMLAEYGGGRVAIVPGGADFADTVRKLQRRWKFDELAAHNMATLAMAQTALMLHSLEPRLVLAAQDAEIRAALHAGRPALWLPYAALRDAPDTLTSWEVTGDSLALWLARRLNVERLVLVKSCAVPQGRSLAQLSEAGVVDLRFPHWAIEAPFPIEVVQHDQLGTLRDALVGGSVPDREP
jgi:5-(aminomethyl)-3-furanmethanol phosphate kinase